MVTPAPTYTVLNVSGSPTSMLAVPAYPLSHGKGAERLPTSLSLPRSFFQVSGEVPEKLSGFSATSISAVPARPPSHGKRGEVAHFIQVSGEAPEKHKSCSATFIFDVPAYPLSHGKGAERLPTSLCPPHCLSNFQRGPRETLKFFLLPLFWLCRPVRSRTAKEQRSPTSLSPTLIFQVSGEDPEKL